MNNIDIPFFNGGWSYTQKEMNSLFRFIKYKDDYSILEFGAGDSTHKLWFHFKKYTKNLSYTVFETDPLYTPLYPEIKTIVYDANDIDSIEIPVGTFDLILVDGPNGDKRAKWYSKIRKSVKPGTIILVDDFNHFASFRQELDKNFQYETLDHFEIPFVAWGEHSWKIVKVIRTI
jgi:hypothetical protein